jgi:ribosome assembly protein 4
MDNQSGNASVMCQLVSPEGDHLGAPLYLPQNVGPPQLQEIVNHLLHNVLTTLSRLCFCYAIT